VCVCVCACVRVRVRVCAVDEQELSRFGAKFSAELTHQMSQNHVLLSALDPAHGTSGRQSHRFVCLVVLLTSLLTLGAVWYGHGHHASDHELVSGTSSFSVRDAGTALVVACISFLLAALLLEIFHCRKTTVRRQRFRGKGKEKANAYSHMAPLQRRCVSQTEKANSLGRSLSPRPPTLTCSYTYALVCVLW